MQSTKTLDEFLGKGSPNFPTFEWTGHPFVDAGLIAILLLSKKSRPQDLTWSEREQFHHLSSTEPGRHIIGGT
ncbi:hypothetical protein [Pyrococcus kukulkanii]|uniref:Uncharacterized protein n=1 Tax=Pyrococcus kukulkanii TaxID=1609559 RepID=A0ABV4T8Q0_9EURY